MLSHRSDNSTFIEPTELRLNKTYTLYYVHWTRAFLLAFLPFTLLAVLNGRIIHQIWKAEKISARTMQRVSQLTPLFLTNDFGSATLLPPGLLTPMRVYKAHLRAMNLLSLVP